MDNFEETCWICLSADQGESDLIRPCGCPRLAHKKCLAKWQLHSAGREEEKQCRFCHQVLPDWREAMANGSHCINGAAYMTITHQGRMRRVKVEAGEEGRQKFEQEVRKFLEIPPEQQFDALFECRAPDTGENLELRGLSAWDAAVHCAALASSPEDALVTEARSRFINAVSTIQRTLSTSILSLRQNLTTASTSLGSSLRRTLSHDRKLFRTATWKKAPMANISWPCGFCAYGDGGMDADVGGEVDLETIQAAVDPQLGVPFVGRQGQERGQVGSACIMTDSAADVVSLGESAAAC